MSDWRTLAACRGMDVNIFVPSHGVPATRALAVCRECEVRTECLEDALATQAEDGRKIYGVRGGTTDADRKHCGSLYGHNLHHRHGQTPCSACREAFNAYRRGRRAGDGGAA